MANIFEKGTKFAATALALLRKQVKAPGLFTIRYSRTDFQGAAGDVLNIKRPAVLVARDKGWRNDDAIVIDNLVQTKIQVALNAHPYSAVALSTEEETLDEIDYVRDVQAPQVAAILDWFENLVVSTIGGADFVFEVDFNIAATDGTEDPRKVAIQARKLFQDAHVPTAGRYWLVGSSVSAAIASYTKLLDVETAGLPEAVRDGIVGRLAGFTIIELDALDPSESYFVHETAIALAVVAPAVPNGVAKGGGVAAANGLALTQLWDYDSDHLKDRSIVHALAGAAVITDPEVNADGSLVLDGSNNPSLKFMRAIKVIFGAATGSKNYTAAITGAPTGGTFTLTVDGEVTDAIAYNATAAVIAAELNELDSVSQAKVTGTTTKTVAFNEYVTMTGTASFTGGTSPALVVTAV